MALAEQIGSKVRELREQRGLTQSRLAEAASMTSDEVSRIERGAREPRFDTLERLASALNVPVGELFSQQRGNASHEGRQAYTFRKPASSPASEAARIAQQCARAVERILVGHLRSRPAGRRAPKKR